MPRLKNSLSQLYRNLWLTIAVFIMVVFVFIVYVRAEKEIDQANELRHQSILLADELRHSSNNLTRMLHGYVITNNAIYKHLYREILDIRDGRRPRPADYQDIYWDLLLHHEQKPPRTGKTIPLIELFRNIGMTEEEFAKLAEANAHADKLTGTESEAMQFIESARPVSDAARLKASMMLQQPAYLQAKADAMRAIGEFKSLMDQRTIGAIKTAESTAIWVRTVLIVFGCLLIIMLYLVYRTLYATLGGSVEELHEHIVRLGHGDFHTIPVP